MVSSTKLLTDFNENIWSPLLDKVDEMNPTTNNEQPTTVRKLINTYKTRQSMTMTSISYVGENSFRPLVGSNEWITLRIGSL